MVERNFPIEDGLTKWRSAIIASVLQNGLKSGETLTKQGGRYLGSSSRKPPCSVEGVVISPPSFYHTIDLFSKNLQSALYKGVCAVLPVIAERPDDKRLNADMKINKVTVSKRVNSSFLVICWDEPLFRTTRPEETVKPDQFLYLIFPDRIWNQANTDLMLSPQKEGSLLRL